MLKKSFLLLALTLMIAAPVLAAERVAVAFSGAELRSAPSAMTSKVVAKVARLEPLVVKKVGPEYLLVSDYTGRSGYIHKTLVKEVPTVIVTGDRANVRSGAGTTNDVVFQLAKGDTAKLVTAADSWVQIELTDGRQGWIADFLVWGE
jgi:uncharacterized protein YgiM (DUF1202 family)